MKYRVYVFNFMLTQVAAYDFVDAKLVDRFVEAKRKQGFTCSIYSVRA